jgi:hypothetical protein
VIIRVAGAEMRTSMLNFKVMFERNPPKAIDKS